MKKLLTITMLIMTFISFNGVNANKPEFEWTTEEAFSGNYYLVGTLQILGGVNYLEIDLPVSYYNLENYQGLNGTLGVYGNNDVLLTTINWGEHFGDQYDGTFIIDFEAHGVTSQIYYIVLKIPQNWGALPSGLITYYDTNATNEQLYEPFAENYFVRSEYSSDLDLYVSKPIDIPYNTYSLSVDLFGIYHYVNRDGYRGNIKLYDDSDVLLDTLYYDEFIVTNNAMLFRFIIPYDTYDVNDAVSFTIEFVYREVPYSNVIDANNNIEVTYGDDEFGKIEFYSQNVRIDNQIVFLGNRVTVPEPTPPTNFEFVKYVFEDGTAFESDKTTITSDMWDENNIIRVYAVYTYAEDTPTTNTTNPTASEDAPIIIILNDWGLNNDVGRVLVYVLIMVIVAVLLILVFKVPPFVVLVTNFLVMILFTYWAILPIYATLSGYIVQAFALFLTSNRGGVANVE